MPAFALLCRRSAVLLLGVLLVLLMACSEAERPEYTVAWSHYAGWEPWGYAADAGILQRRAREAGIRVHLVNVDAVTGFDGMIAGRFDGFTVTSVEALTALAAEGVAVDGLLATSWSNGNDGIVMRGGIGVADLKGRAVHLVQDSVSGYVLWRARDLMGLGHGELAEFDVSEDEVMPLLRTDPTAVVVTWNPLLWESRSLQGARVVFDSRRLPKELLDLMVVRQDAPEALKQVLVGTWFETMALLQGVGAERNAAIEAMAASTGVSVDAFESQLATTALQTTPAQMRALLRDPVVREALARQLRYAEQRGALAPGTVGVELAGKHFVGNPEAILLRLDGAWLPDDAR